MQFALINYDWKGYFTISPVTGSMTFSPAGARLKNIFPLVARKSILSKVNSFVLHIIPLMNLKPALFEDSGCTDFNDILVFNNHETEKQYLLTNSSYREKKTCSSKDKPSSSFLEYIFSTNSVSAGTA